MTASIRTYILGGMGLVLIGLIFGLWYAIFAEHQTLDAMGRAFAGSFTEAARRNREGVEDRLAALGAASYRYLREVSTHAHIIELGTLALIVPLFSHRIRWSEGKKLLLARFFIAGSFLFCLGVYLQTLLPGRPSQALAAAGSGLVIACVSALALGLTRSSPPDAQLAESGER